MSLTHSDLMQTQPELLVHMGLIPQTTSHQQPASNELFLPDYTDFTRCENKSLSLVIRFNQHF